MKLFSHIKHSWAFDLQGLSVSFISWEQEWVLGLGNIIGTLVMKSKEQRGTMNTLYVPSLINFS